MEELQRAREQQRLSEEMAECTFKPTIGKRQDKNAVTGPRSRSFERNQ